MPEPMKPDWTEVRAKWGSFPVHAFSFVREGLAHTVKIVHGEDAAEAMLPPDDESRHVSGQQLCLGLRDYANRRYGLLARTVLRRWGVERTEDFGRIVFSMIELGWMRKTDEDTLEDFRDVYDFDEAFGDLRPMSPR